MKKFKHAESLKQVAVSHRITNREDQGNRKSDTLETWPPRRQPKIARKITEKKREQKPRKPAACVEIFGSMWNKSHIQS